MIAILDYGIGNLKSVETAITTLGLPCTITSNPEVLQNSNAIVLPGVGSYAKAVHTLKNSSLFPVLEGEVVMNKKPFLGICLGMQILSDDGLEDEKTQGLGWIPGKVISMKSLDNNIKIPHIGFNSIQSKDKKFEKINNKDFYFTHSYHFLTDDRFVIGTTNYGTSSFNSFVRSENIWGVQFHPEKSQINGLIFLQTFFNEYSLC